MGKYSPLKPCPFCGGKAVRNSIRFGKVPPLVRVYCRRCECGTLWMRIDWKDAVAAWNRRETEKGETNGKT